MKLVSLNEDRPWSGMNWISQKKRLAIYLRDGLRCLYCSRSLEDESLILTLDHVRPHSKGGDNSETNLVTCCRRCNTSRNNTDLTKFVKLVVEKFAPNDTPEEIYKRIRRHVRRKLDTALAGQLLEVMGSVKNFLEDTRSKNYQVS